MYIYYVPTERMHQSIYCTIKVNIWYVLVYIYENKISEHVVFVGDWFRTELPSVYNSMKCVQFVEFVFNMVTIALRV